MGKAFFGPDAKNWFSNGLNELQQAFVLSVQQIEPGTLPTMFTPTSGQITQAWNEQNMDPEPTVEPSPEPSVDPDFDNEPLPEMEPDIDME